MTDASARIAIVGFGRMGERHAEAARLLGHDVVAVCDPDRGARDRAGAVTGAVYADIAELLDAAAVDCVVVSSLADSHVDHVLAAARAGVGHVLCEKPLATSLEGADRMLAGCDAAGTRLAVNHQMRYMAHYAALADAVGSPAFGGWRSLTAVTGNMGLAMNGVHYFELFRWLAGEPLDEVTAWLSSGVLPNSRGERYLDRAGVVRATASSGRRFYLDASADQGHGLVVTVAGGAGVAVLDELAGELAVSARDDEHRAAPTTRYASPAERRVATVPPTSVVAPTAALLHDLLAGADHPTGTDGRTALATLVAAHASAERGGPVRVADAPVDLVLPIA